MIKDSFAGSWLCSSPLINNLYKKSVEFGANVVHYDLEDSVPANKKDEARQSLLSIFKKLPDTITTALRINALFTLDGLKDILFLVENNIRPNIIILPKSSLDADVLIANSILNSKKDQKIIKIFSVIETVSSFMRVRHIQVCPNGLQGVIFGSADFALDLGLIPGESDLNKYMVDIALFAKNFGIVAIDSPCFKIDNVEKLKHEINNAKKLGFLGKIAIHPSQVKLINDGFLPSESEIAQVNRIISTEKQSNISSIASLNGDMYGPPFIKYAKKIIESINKIGAI